MLNITIESIRTRGKLGLWFLNRRKKNYRILIKNLRKFNNFLKIQLKNKRKLSIKLLH